MLAQTLLSLVVLNIIVDMWNSLTFFQRLVSQVLGVA